MEKLRISKGGKLIETKWHPEDRSYKEHDVTDQAIRCLFETCSLEEGVTLKDVFLLLNTELELFDAILGNWCKDIVTEGLTQPEKLYTGQYDPDGIEYLELYKTVHTQQDGSYGLTRPDFHGVGFELTEDKLFDWGDVEWPKGERIPWGLSFSKSNELINIPLKLDNKLNVYDDDHDSADWGKKLFTIEKPDFTLGDILNGVIWELSFHGGPDKRDELGSELHDIVAQIKKENSES